MKHLIALKVNNIDYEVAVEPRRTLAELLREDLNFTGTKIGCSIGDCGACTVLMDGIPVFSCLVLAVEAAGCEILTIEGLSENGKLHPIQKSFVEVGAIQCGFCTSGMVLNVLALLKETPDPSENDIRLALSGNLCRCTGYQKIIDAVKDAGKEMRKE
ncbi:(2Fe-2S)-binding protein [bacterium]|nr:(2Fe-2S)-binding protein [bacterium]